ncbi:AEC family transporter [Sphingomonas sp. HITSZ_GF]|uniref:AEC family transporter n=1 Tax=Sphingomonas sp. HITSZ_GF TaxID=3037247 RepID=UPI00240D1060|nr:AEC family transporter [Sphingomonas sp. HITSZ_GF]MDG2532228.1 AEC family transporter [Sphingomonas sp. HITSZ_GF]
MLSILLIVLPIFALIAAGWGARRTGMLGPHATRELNRFVVFLALPALLFDIVAKARWGAIWQPGFIAAFGLGAGIVLVLTVLLRLRGGRHLADAAVDGLNAGYANTAFIGFPLTAAVLGPAAQTPTLIASILTVCVLFGFALLLIEIGIQTERHPARMAASVARALGTNPLLVAPALGALFLAFGIPVPEPVDKFLTLLGGAASPCALVALGLFIAEKRDGGPAPVGTVALLAAMKLLLQPLVTWLLATQLFHLAPPLAAAAVLLAALPTGTGPFMVAEFYGREAGITARVVLVSTLASLLTITLYLALA